MNTNTRQTHPDNIVPSGLHPAPAPTLDRKVLEHADGMCAAIKASVAASLARIKEAERTAIARLDEYVPRERLLTSKEAAAYLRIPLRSLHLMTCPANRELPFNWIGGQKRFRKAQLDAHLDRTEVKRAELRL